MQSPAPHEAPLDEARAWSLLSRLAERASSGHPIERRCGLRLDARGQLEVTAPDHGWLALDPSAETEVSTTVAASAPVAQLLDLYLPLCVGKASSSTVVAHVGQSLDGQIATKSGASRYVTGPENIRHLHRLRALSDAVIVGAGTVEHDDPQLTTRLVPGKSPVRVVIDPGLRLSEGRGLFQDGAADTLVICARGRASGKKLGRAEIVEVAADDAMLPPSTIVRTLNERGLRRLFIEGGGVTVSRFIESRALHRLHVTIGSVLIGRGRPGISLPEIDDLGQALRPRTRRFLLGSDVLFDCALEPD